jgi:hypothetical protein
MSNGSYLFESNPSSLIGDAMTVVTVGTNLAATRISNELS